MRGGGIVEKGEKVGGGAEWGGGTKKNEAGWGMEGRRRGPYGLTAG